MIEFDEVKIMTENDKSKDLNSTARAGFACGVGCENGMACGIGCGSDVGSFCGTGCSKG